MAGPDYDLAVIGGGINGCGIARDAAGRGLSVYLCEQNDLASGTSSKSTKLIHGGLRYLEFFEFRLVREALKEREVLLGIAPHIITPLRFVLPYRKSLRSSWKLRLGLFLYDHLGGRRRLPATRALDLHRDAAGEPLQADLNMAFEYSDCWVDDARLVVLNAMDARERGATIETRTKLVGARRGGADWALDVQSSGAAPRTIRARAVVNAAGPWVSDVLTGALGVRTNQRVRMVRGSHIVVPRLFDHDRCYIFQNEDGRIVFAIPYEDDFTLVGTTDEDHVGGLDAVAASEDEINYLIGAANAYFRRAIQREDIRWTYSGVRPLFDDGASKAQEATRDYVLSLDETPEKAPLLSVYGGKITTYRRLAESALEKLAGFLPPSTKKSGWTGRAPLPGGDFPVDGFDALVRDLGKEFPFLDPHDARRMARCYGTRARAMLAGARNASDLGEHFGAGLTAREVRYLMREEWAATLDDLLWRRSKLGLHLDDVGKAALANFLKDEAREGVIGAMGVSI